MVFELVQSAADWIVYTLLGLSPTSPVGSSLNFFLYDTVKIFILLIVIVYAVTFLRSFFSPEKTRAWLAERKGSTFIGHILAALLGIITPFCSCSAVPLFIGFVEAGIPLGVTFTYLIAAPMVNEVALVMLYGMFGWKVAVVYLVSGEVIAIVAGLIIGRLKLERFVEEYVYQVKVKTTRAVMHESTYAERFQESWIETFDIIKRIWLYVVIGIGIGALMHGWVPAGALAAYAGKDNPFAVIVAVIIGIPLYSNAAGIIPLVSEMTRAGVSSLPLTPGVFLLLSRLQRLSILLLSQ